MTDQRARSHSAHQWRARPVTEESSSIDSMRYDALDRGWAARASSNDLVGRMAATGPCERVLAPRGVAFIQVPIRRIETFEDFTVSTPEERLSKFFHPTHVRLYGLDITDRFEAAGFSSEIYRAQDFGPEPLLQYGLSFASTNEVFVFQK